jgi:hypothetical protein
MIDKFRGTSRPLLSVLADKDSVFFKGLAMFQNKVLYTNIVNDRTVSWYTSSISRNDPFANLAEVSLNYVPGYAPTILDPETPVQPLLPPQKNAAQNLPVSRRLGKGVAKLPWLLVYALLVPIGIILFLVNSLLQTALSSRRIRLHSNQKEWHDYASMPLLLAEEIQEAADSVFEEMNHELVEPDHLPSGSEGQGGGGDGSDSEDGEGLTDSMLGIDNQVPESVAVEEKKSQKGGDDDDGKRKQPEFPTLALLPSQFRMIHNLDSLGFRKFPVWIQLDKHSHAAIIVRKPKAERWKEGRVVVRHWVEEAFEI